MTYVWRVIDFYTHVMLVTGGLLFRTWASPGAVEAAVFVSRLGEVAA